MVVQYRNVRGEYHDSTCTDPFDPGSVVVEPSRVRIPVSRRYTIQLDLLRRLRRRKTVYRSVLAWRMHRRTTRVLGPLFPQNHDVVQMDITYECNLRCLRCGRQCAQAPSTDRITIPQIEKFIVESVAQGRRWRMLRIMGGEPMLHPDIQRIVELLCEYRDRHSPRTILRLETNGFGPRVRKRLARIPPGVVVQDNHKQRRDDPAFVQFNVAPVDLSSMRSYDFVHGCSNRTACGLGFTPFGFYTCGSAGAIDRVFGFGIGRRRIPDRRDRMLDQTRKLCRYCGFFWSDALAETRQSDEDASETWQVALRRYADHRPRLERY